MISRVEKNEEELLKGGVNSPLYARIYTEFYNNKNDFNAVYVQRSVREEITAILSCKDGRCALVTLDSPNLEELKSFFELNGIISVITLDVAAARYLFKDIRVYNALKLSFAPLGECKSSRITSELPESFHRSLYSCLSLSGSVSFESFYCDFSPKLFKNLSDGCYIDVDGIVASCALTPYISKTASIISGVSTLERYRRRGFAGDCVKNLCRCLTSRGITDIYLWCEDSRLSFYKSLGFEEFSKIYIGR